MISLVNLVKSEGISLFVTITKDILTENEVKVMKMVQLWSFLTFEIFENESGHSKELKGQFRLIFGESREVFHYKFNLEEYKLRIFDYLENKWFFKFWKKLKINKIIKNYNLISFIIILS